MHSPKSPVGFDFKNISRALKYRNFRLFFVGQGLSLIGTWMQTIAMSWLVFRLTHSTFLLGLVGFSSQIPAFIVSPFAGVLVDRWNRHKTLISTQTLSMIQAFILTYLVATSMIQVWQIILLSVFLGLINAIDMPMRQTFVVDMVENKSDVGNAIALNSALFNSARLIGPSIAGLLIAVAGEGVCFFINGVSYLAVIVALLLMQIKEKSAEKVSKKILLDLKEGLLYTFGFAPIRVILLMLALVSLIGMSFPVLMPVFATVIFHGGPHTLGFLVASSGVGSIVGTIFLASRKSVLGLGRIIVIASVIFASGLIAFSYSHDLILSQLILLFTGFGMIVQMAASNTILQTIVDEDKRGRVMSFYTMAFMGTAPFGSLIAGALSTAIGAPLTVRIGGLIAIVGAILFALYLPSLRVAIHPIYKKLGIIPEVASGI